MKKCPRCETFHGPNHPHFTFSKKINDKGFPTSSKHYETAHKAASKAEKEKYPKGYQELKKYDETAGKNGQSVGKNTKSGKIIVSGRVPKRFDREIAFHERTESRKIKQLDKNTKSFDKESKRTNKTISKKGK